MLPFEIPTNALYKLFFITSVTVLNGLIKLTTLTLPTYSSSIPDRTLTFIYQFLESFAIDTDIDLLNNSLPIQTTIDISYLIEHLYRILIEANYIPRFRNTETTRTLEYRAAIAFMQQDILPVPNSRILKRILFRARYIEDLSRQLCTQTNEFTQWPITPQRARRPQQPSWYPIPHTAPSA